MSDEFKAYTRATLADLLRRILRGSVYALAAAMGPPRPTGRQRTRRLWRKRGRR